MFVRVFQLILLAASLVSTALHAQDSVKNHRLSSSRDLQGGLVIDQTVTFLGQNFTRFFLTYWSDLDVDERFTLTIKERPTALHGSFISIEYLGRAIYTAKLSPRSANSKAAAETVARQVFEKVVAISVEKLFDREPELAGDEL